ncbi:MAG: hypothetical protein ABIH35_03310 [Patescibacteria group bacterium]
MSSVFNQIRQLKLAQNKQRKLEYAASSNGVKVKVLGDLRIAAIELPSSVDGKIAEDLKKVLNKSIHAAQTDSLKLLRSVNSGS